VGVRVGAGRHAPLGRRGQRLVLAVLFPPLHDGDAVGTHARDGDAQNLLRLLRVLVVPKGGRVLVRGRALLAPARAVAHRQAHCSQRHVATPPTDAKRILYPRSRLMANQSTADWRGAARRYVFRHSKRLNARPTPTDSHTRFGGADKLETRRIAPHASTGTQCTGTQCTGTHNHTDTAAHAQTLYSPTAAAHACEAATRKNHPSRPGQ
jgi:hypothetical protein